MVQINSSSQITKGNSKKEKGSKEKRSQTPVQQARFLHVNIDRLADYAISRDEVDGRSTSEHWMT